MTYIKDVQYFIHKHYENIKLILLLLIATMVVLFFVATIQGIKDESEKQTGLINAQFKALCIIVVQTAGDKGLEELDPPLDARCRDLTKPVNDSEDTTGSTPAPVGGSSSSRQATSPTASTTRPVSTPAQPTSPSQGQENVYQRLLDATVKGATSAVTGLTNAINTLRGR